jgi:adenosine deaminase
MNTIALIRNLPKAEQHIHIVGATRPETLLWLVQEGDIKAPYETLEDVERFFQYRDFEHFISVYSTVMRSIVDESQFERITYEMLENENECNVRHVEASFSAPDHIRLGLDYGLMLDAINRGIRRANQSFGIECILRIDLVRNYGPESGMETLSLIEEKRDNIVTIDIGGSESGFPPEPFKKVYTKASEMGLHLVAHAGEAAGPESIRGALEYLRAERIGHGTTAIHDKDLLKLIRERNVTIEACPVSNVRTGVIPSIGKHPLREFLNFGIRTTVNSDDPSMFDTNINNEFIQLHQQLGFSIPELFQLSLNAIDSAFISDYEKKSLRDNFIKEYQSLMDHR